jgi:hypothetical protein
MMTNAVTLTVTIIPDDIFRRIDHPTQKRWSVTTCPGGYQIPFA